MPHLRSTGRSARRWSSCRSCLVGRGRGLSRQRLSQWTCLEQQVLQNQLLLDAESGVSLCTTDRVRSVQRSSSTEDARAVSAARDRLLCKVGTTLALLPVTLHGPCDAQRHAWRSACYPLTRRDDTVFGRNLFFSISTTRFKGESCHGPGPPRDTQCVCAAPRQRAHMCACVEM